MSVSEPTAVAGREQGFLDGRQARGLADLLTELAGLSDGAYVLIRRGGNRASAPREWRVNVRAGGQDLRSSDRESVWVALEKSLTQLRRIRGARRVPDAGPAKGVA